MRQFKDLEQTLASLGILSGASLVVQPGTDAGEGKFSFRISFIKLIDATSYESDDDPMDASKITNPLDPDEGKQEKLIEKTALGRVTVEAGCSLSVFKDTIFRELVEPRADELGIRSAQ
jgi:hypothetical protein